MMEPAGRWTRLSLSAAVLLSACAPRQPEQAASAAAPCLPPGEGALADTIDMSAWAGEYRLTLVATSGPKADVSETGTLTLAVPDESHRRPPRAYGDTTTMLPLAGATSVDPEAVGAVKLGSLTSTDPDRPGVLVLANYGKPGEKEPSVTIRLGSEANDWSKIRFDGGYTAMYVRQADGQGFAGEWRSGVTTTVAGGHFCARRVAG